MSDKKNRVCPVELHSHLDNKLRKLIHNPHKILKPYVKKGDTAVDFGCGPGYFTLPMADLTGEIGVTIAADLQQGMLDIVQNKIKNTPYEKRIRLHRTEQNTANMFIKADFTLLFYMVHEVPDQKIFFKEVKEFTKPGGRVLIIEPPVHVTKKDFERTKLAAEHAGFRVEKGPKLFLDRTAILKG